MFMERGGGTHTYTHITNYKVTIFPKYSSKISIVLKKRVSIIMFELYKMLINITELYI